jgi:hypothetical protein
MVDNVPAVPDGRSDVISHRGEGAEATFGMPDVR